MADTRALFDIALHNQNTGLREVDTLQRYLTDQAKTNYMNVQSQIGQEAANLANAQRAALGGPESGVNSALLGSGAALTGYLESRMNPQKAQAANAFNQGLSSLMQSSQQQKQAIRNQYNQDHMNAFNIFREEDAKNAPFTLGTFLQNLPAIAGGIAGVATGNPMAALGALGSLGG